MKAAAFVLALLGAILGGIITRFEYIGMLGPPDTRAIVITLAASGVGLLGGLLLLLGRRLGTWLCLLGAVSGVFGASILWEAAGSFFLVAMMMGFSLRQKDGETVKAG